MWNPAVTLQQVATAAGVGLTTASYSLRGDPRITAATQAKVRAAAERLGYRPNPRFSALMAHIRHGRKLEAGDRIAFVWVHVTREASRRDPFLQKVFVGARRRAEQAGFSLEQFWTADRGMNDRRLEQILRARGLVGVVLSPVMTNEAAVALDWNWASFAAAVIGNVTWTPELHHAGHHHFLGMRLALRELHKLGCTRPAALIEPESSARAKRAWEAAFLTDHPTGPERAHALVRLYAADEQQATIEWLRESRPDALIVSDTRLLSANGIRTVCRELKLKMATLYWSEQSPEIGGVDQCYDRVAAHAVDLVLAQLNSNETGVPDLPRMMLFPGRWVPGEKILTHRAVNRPSRTPAGLKGRGRVRSDD